MLAELQCAPLVQVNHDAFSNSSARSVLQCAVPPDIFKVKTLVRGNKISRFETMAFDFQCDWLSEHDHHFENNPRYQEPERPGEKAGHLVLRHHPPKRIETQLED